MDPSNSSSNILKILILIGGLFESVMGVIIILWGNIVIALATGMQLIPNYPLYWRTMGLLAIALGFLQIVASRDLSRYALVPTVACFVRFILPVLTILQILETPVMTGVLILSTGFDLILAMVTIVMLYKEGYLSISVFE